MTSLVIALPALVNWQSIVKLIQFGPGTVEIRIFVSVSENSSNILSVHSIPYWRRIQSR